MLAAYRGVLNDTPRSTTLSERSQTINGGPRNYFKTQNRKGKNMKGRLIIVSGLLTFLLFGAWVTAQAQTQSARGGSFFMQFQQDPNNCHGVIKNYDNADAKTQIQTNLHTMQTNGQQKLTVWIGHLREDSSCGVPGANGVNMRSDVMNGQPTCCDYTNYEYQYITNLHNYLSDAQTLYGFNQVVIIMGPELNNWPRNWESYTWGVDNYYYYENWYTVTQVVQAVPPGMPFIIILADEALLPTTSSAPMVQYVHDIWQQYLQTYGTTTGRNQAGFTIGGVRQTAGVKCTDQYGSAVDCETPTNQINDFIAQMNDVGLGLPNYWPLNMFDYDTNDTNRQNAN